MAALFRHYPAHRSALMSDFLSHVIGQLGAGGRAPARPCIVGAGAGRQQAAVQVASAAVVRMVQASVSLPPLDAPPDAVRACYGAAAAWAGAFWDGVFDLLPAARAAKSDSAQDTKAVVESLLADMLALQCLPEWPAANVLLRLFAKVLSGPKGLSHADTGVKGLCVDLTGHLVRGLCDEALTVRIWGAGGGGLWGGREMGPCGGRGDRVDGRTDGWSCLAWSRPWGVLSPSDFKPSHVTV